MGLVVRLSLYLVDEMALYWKENEHKAEGQGSEEMEDREDEETSELEKEEANKM